MRCVTIYVDDTSRGTGRIYCVSGTDTHDSSPPFDSQEFGTKKDAVAFARECRRANGWLGRGDDSVTIYVCGELL